MRLSPASLAATVCPDTASFETPFALTLPLSSQLTGRELEGRAGVVHVYRYDRDVQGRRSLPYRKPLAGRIVEVASTAPDGARPAFVSRATIDARAGTITFTTLRLGTFQAFLEVPRSTLPLLRETFDDARSPDGITVPLPDGWVAGSSWQVAPPHVPACSFPYVLGTNVRGASYRAGADDAVTTRSIIVGGAIPADRQLSVRFQERVRLKTGDTAALEVVLPDGRVVGIPAARRSGPFATPGDAFVDVGPIDVTDAVGGAPSFQLHFRLQSDHDGHEDRGRFVDDLEVAIESR
jgi:hypothetical protein